MGLEEVLKSIIGVEIIDGSNVKETAEMVDLDVAYKLFLVENMVQQEDIELVSNIPSVVLAKKRPDGKYQIDFESESGPDFRIVTAEQAKVMRARFLLLKGFYFEKFYGLSYSQQQEVAVKYDFGYMPPEDMLTPQTEQ